MTTAPMPTTFPATGDALTMLRDDRHAINASFDELALIVAAQAPQHSAADRDALLQRAGALLRAHAQVELEVLYPALEAAGADLAQARQDKHELMSTLDDLLDMSAADPEFGLRLATLIGGTRAHAAYEEAQLLPRAKSLDTAALGAQMAYRRALILGDKFTH